MTFWPAQREVPPCIFPPKSTFLFQFSSPLWSPWVPPLPSLRLSLSPPTLLLYSCFPGFKFDFLLLLFFLFMLFIFVLKVLNKFDRCIIFLGDNKLLSKFIHEISMLKYNRLNYIPDQRECIITVDGNIFL